jgi:hypothetical protein
VKVLKRENLFLPKCPCCKTGIYIDSGFDQRGPPAWYPKQNPFLKTNLWVRELCSIVMENTKTAIKLPKKKDTMTS